MNEIYLQITDYIMVLTIRDYIELIFLVIVVYRIGCWLQRDTNKRLLWYVYGYGALLTASYICTLYTITLFLAVCVPIVAVLCVVFHRDTLQKNYVSVRNTEQSKVAIIDDWLAIFMRFCVRSMHEGRSLSIIIEHRDCLSSLLTTGMKLHAPLTQELLEMLTSAASFDAQLLIWINTKGYIVGVNTRYTQEIHESYVQSSAQKYDTWVHNALLYTSKTDAIVLRTNTKNNMCTVIAQEKVFTPISASVALRTIHHYLGRNDKDMKKGELHVLQSANDFNEQHHS